MFTINGQFDQTESCTPKPILVNSPTIANSILQLPDSKKTVDSLRIHMGPEDPQQQQQISNMDDFEIKQPIGIL